MASDPALLQMQIRRNQEDMQDILKSLDSWEDEIKKRDELLTKQKPILKKTLPPIRGKTKQSREKTKGDSHKKPERIKSYDYSAWSKFDVEGACEDMDSLPSEEEDKEEDEEASRRERAILEKERGNQLFKEGKYEAAIERYTEAITLDPLSAILPANRAMALLKLERYAAAEKDCDMAIALDERYVKAWMRRATARIKLNKLEPAVEDLTQVLKLEPKNKQAKAELDKIEKLQATAPPKQQSNRLHRVQRPVHLRSKEPLVRIQIEEIGGATNMQPSVVKEEKIEWKERKVAQPESVEIDTQQKKLELPTSSIQFQCHWKALHSNRSELAQYFKALPLTQYPVILRQSLESETFSDIIDILEKDYVEQGLSCYDELQWLTKVERFSVAVLFLSKRDKQGLRNIFESLLNLCEDKASVHELAKQYSVLI